MLKVRHRSGVPPENAGRLQQVFPEHDSAAIWNAVDMVGRFQGQQRNGIIGSFGLGDPDPSRAEDKFLYLPYDLEAAPIGE